MSKWSDGSSWKPSLRGKAMPLQLQISMASSDVDSDERRVGSVYILYSSLLLSLLSALIALTKVNNKPLISFNCFPIPLARSFVFFKNESKINQNEPKNEPKTLRGLRMRIKAGGTQSTLLALYLCFLSEL